MSAGFTDEYSHSITSLIISILEQGSLNQKSFESLESDLKNLGKIWKKFGPSEFQLCKKTFFKEQRQVPGVVLEETAVQNILFKILPKSCLKDCQYQRSLLETLQTTNMGLLKNKSQPEAFFLIMFRSIKASC